MPVGIHPGATRAGRLLGWSIPAFSSLNNYSTNWHHTGVIREPDVRHTFGTKFDKKNRKIITSFHTWVTRVPDGSQPGATRTSHFVGFGAVLFPDKLRCGQDLRLKMQRHHYSFKTMDEFFLTIMVMVTLQIKNQHGILKNCAVNHQLITGNFRLSLRDK